MSSIAGELITERLEYDGGRQVTVYVPPVAAEAIVFAGDGHLVSQWSRSLEAADAPSTMIVGVHPLAGFDKVLHYRVPASLEASVAPGSLVRMPVLNSLRLGIVGEIGAPKDFPIEKLKSLAQVLHPFRHLGFVRRCQLERSGAVRDRMRVDAGDGGNVSDGGGADGGAHDARHVSKNKTPRQQAGASVISG